MNVPFIKRGECFKIIHRNGSVSKSSAMSANEITPVDILASSSVRKEIFFF